MWNVSQTTSIWRNSVVINSPNWRLPLGAFIGARMLGGNIVLNVAPRFLNSVYFMCPPLLDVGPARKNTKRFPDTDGKTELATMNSLPGLPPRVDPIGRAQEGHAANPSRISLPQTQLPWHPSQHSYRRQRVGTPSSSWEKRSGWSYHPGASDSLPCRGDQ